MIWTDAHISPVVVDWIVRKTEHEAVAIRDLGLRDASDEVVFSRAGEKDVILLTKDADFPELVTRLGPPPKVIWLRIGNTSNYRLIQILETHLDEALRLLSTDTSIVEIRNASGGHNR